MSNSGTGPPCRKDRDCHRGCKRNRPLRRLSHLRTRAPMLSVLNCRACELDPPM